MLELVTLVWVFVAFFAFMGLQRGWTKEIISMSGVILGLFALHQFDTVIRQQLLAAFTPDQKFYFQTALFLIIVFFAYQTRALIGSDARAAQGGDGRDALQTRVLGAIVGGVNGYLISGSVWYFLHINRDLATGAYPLDPYIVAPTAGSLSAENLANLPLFVLAQGPGTTGDLLSLMVIILFIVVLVLI
jgi:Colicin V production protein